jgi:sialate O-acetylesterase
VVPHDVELTPAEARAGVRLGLGTIDDSDVAWVNGRQVGRTTNAWTRLAGVPVPPAALRAGPNVLAVRVEDTGGGGGIAGVPAALYVETGGGARRALAGAWRFRVGAVSVRRTGSASTRCDRAVQQDGAPDRALSDRRALWYQASRTRTRWTTRRRTARCCRADRRLAPRVGAGTSRSSSCSCPTSTRPTRRRRRERVGARCARRSGRGVLRAERATVVTIDVGEADDIHPRDKRPGRRGLALAARRLAYGSRWASGRRTARTAWTAAA